MSQKKITVTLSFPWWNDNNQNCYRVEKVNNSLTPEPGQRLTKDQVEKLMSLDNVTVTVTTNK